MPLRVSVILSMNFNPLTLDELKRKLYAIMPGFRDWVEQKKRNKFVNDLAKLVTSGLAVYGTIQILSGIFGNEEKSD
jgi:hypothetical protein